MPNFGIYLASLDECSRVCTFPGKEFYLPPSLIIILTILPESYLFAICFQLYPSARFITVATMLRCDTLMNHNDAIM